MKYLNIKNDNSITIIEIQNGSFNTLNSKVLLELDSFIDSIKNDSKIKCLIITGSGDKAFVAGADIKEMSLMNKVDAANHSKLGQKIFSKIESLHIPVIAAINGYALGGGCELSLACHIRYASKNAYIGQPEVKLGLLAGFGGTQRLPKVVSKGKAMEMLLTGEPIKANFAKELGLINDYYPKKKLNTEVLKIAKKIASKSNLTIKIGKQAFYKQLEMPLSKAYAYTSKMMAINMMAMDAREGISAFLEKRKPNWKNK